MIETEVKQEQALLICLDTGEYDPESSLEELSELCKTAGANPAFTLVQKRPNPDTATCIGSGMAQEAADLCRREEIDLVIFDRELSPTQIRNLEDILECRVIDRTMLILDIFALRAKTREGKLQVELAQLKYLLPRLTGKGIAMSRLGGGIGTRGPGETKLETDRRHIRRRIGSIREQLKGVEASRREIDRRRKKDGTITVALVGYTNAGKSTLMNRLTQAGVLAENKLFATLDPTARALKLPCGKTVMLIDTVGFLRRLPHHLVESFKSTLEQAAGADIILNICDASNEEAPEHLQVTQELLESLGMGEKPVIAVLNKWDAVEHKELALRVPGAVRISALSGYGVDELLSKVEEALPVKTFERQLLLPFAKTGLAAPLRAEGAVLSEEYVPEGLRLHVRVDQRLYGPVKEYDLFPQPEEEENL
jgi:GTP-binding protein HflX